MRDRKELLASAEEFIYSSSLAARSRHVRGHAKLLVDENGPAYILV